MSSKSNKPPEDKSTNHNSTGGGSIRSNSTRGNSRSGKATGRVPAFFERLGPGLVSGAADDDPSGISTYSVTGASFGYQLLWTAILCYPLMAAVQLMCARLGLVSGTGLASVIRYRYSRWILWGSCVLLVFANTVNIGADLGGMAAVSEMMTG